MARIFTEGPKSGLISGKIGNLVYVVKNGKNYTRSIPKKRSMNSFSSSQITGQLRFKKASTLARELLPVFRKGYPQLISGHYPLLMKQLLQLLDRAENGTTDWTSLQLSHGQIHLKIIQQIKGDQLEIYIKNGKRGDQFHYVLLDPETNRMVHYCDLNPEFQLVLPSVDGNYHLFLFVVNGKRGDSSPTYHLGEFQIKQDQVTIR